LSTAIDSVDLSLIFLLRQALPPRAEAASGATRVRIIDGTAMRGAASPLCSI
jgi:hypothetical protein